MYYITCGICVEFRQVGYLLSRKAVPPVFYLKYVEYTWGTDYSRAKLVHTTPRPKTLAWHVIMFWILQISTSDTA